MDLHASGIQAVAAAVTVLLTLVLVGATVMYVIKTQALAKAGEDAVEATKDLIADQQVAREHDHVAAVEAVFQELVSIAKPMALVLVHGNLDVRIPFALVAAYREVFGPLYRGLSPALGPQLATTYSLLDIQRLAFEQMTVKPTQLRLVYNENLVSTLAALHAHLHELGRDVPAPPGAIANDDIALTVAMVAAKKKLEGS